MDAPPKGEEFSCQAWLEWRHRQVFEQTCEHVWRQLRSNPGFTREYLEGLLEAEYVSLGNDWLGRSAASRVMQAATIAAYEHVLAEIDHHGSTDADRL